MSSSAITTPTFQLKAGNIQNQADSSGVYSAGVWSFKNSTAVASVTITDAGNVGIGTASPVSQFDVANDSAPTMTLRNTAQKNWNTGDAIGYLNFRIDDTSSAGARNVAYIRSEVDTGVSNGVTVASNIVFGTSGYDAVATERVRIDASGNLLLGTTSQLGTYKQSIAGADNALALKAATGSQAGEIGFFDTGSTRRWRISTNQTQLYVITDVGTLSFSCRTFARHFDGTAFFHLFHCGKTGWF